MVKNIRKLSSGPASQSRMAHVDGRKPPPPPSPRASKQAKRTANHWLKTQINRTFPPSQRRQWRLAREAQEGKCGFQVFFTTARAQQQAGQGWGAARRHLPGMIARQGLRGQEALGPCEKNLRKDGQRVPTRNPLFSSMMVMPLLPSFD